MVLGSHPLGAQRRDHHADQSTGNAVRKDVESNLSNIIMTRSCGNPTTKWLSRSRESSKQGKQDF